jgi:hypothetical protein
MKMKHAIYTNDYVEEKTHSTENDLTAPYHLIPRGLTRHLLHQPPNILEDEIIFV